MENKPTIVESLEKYFSENSKEKILEDWNSISEFDEIGPTVDEFLKQNNINFIKTTIKFDLINFKHNKCVDPDSIEIYGRCFNWDKLTDFLFNVENLSEIYSELTEEGAFNVEMEIYIDYDDDSSWITFDNYKIEKHV